MDIYIILAVLLILAQFVKKNKKLVFVLLVLLIYCILAFRSENNGIDLPDYIYAFKTNDLDRSYLEPAYMLFSVTLHSITSSVFFFIVVTSAATLFPLIYIIRKESNNKLYSLFYLVISTHYFFLFSGIRQSISISLLLLAFYYLRNREMKLSLIWFVIAGLFHSSSWLFIFIYLIDYIAIKKNYLYVFLIVSNIATFIMDPYFLFKLAAGQGRELVNMSNQGDEMLQWYSSYGSYMVDTQMPVVRLVLYTVPYVFLAFVFLYKTKELKKKENVYVKIFSVGVIVNNLLVANPIGFRLMKAPLLLPMILIPAFFCMFRNKKILYYGYSGFLLIQYFYYIIIRHLTPIENDIVPYHFNSLFL